MHRYETIAFRDAMREYLRQIGLETPLLQHRIVDAWPKVAGDVIARYTKEVRIQGDALVVTISSASLRANLQMERIELARRLNEYVGGQVIQEVRFV